MATDLRQLIAATANSIGISPLDLATAISYETAGTFDPTKRGPTTKWGQHRGFIQFGEPQAQKYGVDWNNPIESQLGPGKAVARYLVDAGVKPGMGMLDVYSAINAGGVGPKYHGRSDTAAGGAPGTVADKVNDQMAGHRRNAEKLFGDGMVGRDFSAQTTAAQNTTPTIFGSMSPFGGTPPGPPSNVSEYAFAEEKPGLGDRMQEAGKLFSKAMRTEAPNPGQFPGGPSAAQAGGLLKMMQDPQALARLMMQRRMG